MNGTERIKTSINFDQLSCSPHCFVGDEDEAKGKACFDQNKIMLLFCIVLAMEVFDRCGD